MTNEFINDNIKINLNGTEYVSATSVDELKLFYKFANDEFGGNIGMAFKDLIQTMLTRPDEFIQIYNILNEHEQRIRVIQDKGIKPDTRPEKKVRKTLSGRLINMPRRE